MLILVAESPILMVEAAEQNREKKFVISICCRFGQRFHWIIIDTFNIQTTSVVLVIRQSCNSAYLTFQTYLFIKEIL